MQEVNWLKKDYTAKFDEYKENAILSSAYYAIMGVTFVGMGEVAKLDAFEWLSSHPKIRTAAEIICRFTDDITSYDVSTNFEFRVLTIYKVYPSFFLSKKKVYPSFLKNVFTRMSQIEYFFAKVLNSFDILAYHDCSLNTKGNT